jgi:Coenzyme PQQ synthesis protein D (PqqD)
MVPLRSTTRVSHPCGDGRSGRITGVPGFSLTSVVIRSDDLLSAPVDHELVMLDPKTSCYHRLDPVGVRIWALLSVPRSVDALCRELEPEFDVSATTCRADVLEFLDRLKHAGLVRAAQ